MIVASSDSDVRLAVLQAQLRYQNIEYSFRAHCQAVPAQASQLSYDPLALLTQLQGLFDLLQVATALQNQQEEHWVGYAIGKAGVGYKVIVDSYGVQHYSIQSYTLCTYKE